MKCITLCLFKYLASSSSNLCVCCTTCGEMLFSQLGNVSAFALFWLAVVSSSSCYTSVLQERTTGREYLGHPSWPVGSHVGQHLSSSIVDWLVQIWYHTVHIKSDPKKWQQSDWCADCVRSELISFIWNQFHKLYFQSVPLPSIASGTVDINTWE